MPVRDGVTRHRRGKGIVFHGLVRVLEVLPVDLCRLEEGLACHDRVVMRLRHLRHAIKSRNRFFMLPGLPVAQRNDERGLDGL